MSQEVCHRSRSVIRITPYALARFHRFVATPDRVSGRPGDVVDRRTVFVWRIRPRSRSRSDRVTGVRVVAIQEHHVRASLVVVRHPSDRGRAAGGGCVAHDGCLSVCAASGSRRCVLGFHRERRRRSKLGDDVEQFWRSPDGTRRVICCARRGRASGPSADRCGRTDETSRFSEICVKSAAFCPICRT